jgi:hypothetical protein
MQLLLSGVIVTFKHSSKMGLESAAWQLVKLSTGDWGMDLYLPASQMCNQPALMWYK